MANLGDISLRMLLDTTGFAGGINTSVQMLGVFQRAQAQAFAPNGPKINTAQYKAEIDGLNNANISFQNSLRQTTAAEQQDEAETQKLANSKRNLSNETSNAKRSFVEFGAQLVVIGAGVKAVGSQIFSFARTSVEGFSKFAETKKYFQGTAEDLELMRKAVGYTVGAGTLMALGNQAHDLGISFSNLPVFFLLAKEAAEKYQTSIEDGFQRAVFATEGSTRGLRAIGIQTLVYKNILTDLVKEHGGEVEVLQGINAEQSINIKNLDPLIAKELQMEAVLKAKGLTLNDVNDRMQTQSDKLKQLDLIVPGVKKQFGEFIAGGLIPLVDGLKNTDGKISGLVVGISGVAFGLTSLLPIIAQIKIAFPEAFAAAQSGASSLISKMAGGFGSGGAVVAAIGLTIAWVVMLGNKMKEVERQNDVLLNQQAILKRGGSFQFVNPQNGQGILEQVKKLEELKAKGIGVILENGVKVNVDDKLKEMQGMLPQMGKTWEEWKNNGTNSVLEVNAKFTELETTISKANEKLKDLVKQKNTPDELKEITRIKSGRDEAQKELDRLNKVINPVTNKGGSSSAKEEWEYTTDIEDAYTRIDEIKKSQAKSTEGSYQFAVYQKQIDELLLKIKLYQTALTDLQKLPDSLTPVTLPPKNYAFSPFGEMIPLPSNMIQPEKNNISPMSRFLKSNMKTKEQYAEENGAAGKDMEERIGKFTGGLSGVINGLGLADTGLGKFAAGLNSGVSVVTNFLQLLSAFGGGGGFDLLGLLFGAGLNMIAPGVGSVVGGALSGGGGGLGGFLGSLFGFGTKFIPGASVVAGAGGGGGGALYRYSGGYTGNPGALAASQSTRVIQQPYIADFTGSGDKLRIVLKSADAKYNRMKGKAD